MNNGIKRRDLIKNVGLSAGGMTLLAAASTSSAQTSSQLTIVTNYTTLRALSLGQVSPGNIIKVSDPGIAGDFLVKSGSIQDNDGTLFQLQDSLYAERIYSGLINAAWFGAKGDDGASNSDGEETALNKAAAFAKNKTLYIPSGTYRITSPVTFQGSVIGDGQRATIIKQYNNDQSICVFASKTDFFRFENIQCAYNHPEDVQTAPALLLENESHNIVIENIFVFGGNPGLLSDQVSFWQTYRNVRVQNANVASFRIDGHRNDQSGAGTTVLMDNVGMYNGDSGIVASTLAQLTIDVVEVGTHSNHCISLSNISACLINTPHFELNNFANAYAKSLVNIFSSNVVINGIVSQENHAKAPHYVTRISSKSTCEVNGISYRVENENQKLFYIDDAGQVPSGINTPYIFRGYGITPTSDGDYLEGSIGRIHIPSFEEFLYTNITNEHGVINQVFPQVPSFMKLHSVQSFVDDNDSALTVTTDRYSESFNSRLRNISDGSAAGISGIKIRSVVRYSHS